MLADRAEALDPGVTQIADFIAAISEVPGLIFKLQEKVNYQLGSLEVYEGVPRILLFIKVDWKVEEVVGFRVIFVYNF